jgi:hypothetical protein
MSDVRKASGTALLLLLVGCAMTGPENEGTCTRLATGQAFPAELYWNDAGPQFWDTVDSNGLHLTVRAGEDSKWRCELKKAQRGGT